MSLGLSRTRRAQRALRAVTARATTLCQGLLTKHQDGGGGVVCFAKARLRELDGMRRERLSCCLHAGTLRAAYKVSQRLVRACIPVGRACMEGIRV